MSNVARKLYRSVLLSTGADAALLEANKAAQADALCVDLEDTVEDKAAARALAASYLASDYTGARGLRINPLTEPEGLEDLLWVRGLSTPPELLVLTMVLDPHELAIVAAMVPNCDLIALIETPEAIEHAGRMAAATDRLCALMFGGKDLAISMGATRNWVGLQWPRGRMVTAAKATGVHALDENFRPLDDLDALAETSVMSRDMGYQGRLTINRAHVPVIHRIYS